MLKIYGRANSINVRKVLWMCHEIGLEYAREDWGRALEMPVYGNTNCWKAEGGDSYQDFLNSECVWMQFWVELPTTADRDRYQAFLDNYARSQKDAGRMPRPLNNRLYDVAQWLDRNEVGALVFPSPAAKDCAPDALRARIAAALTTCTVARAGCGVGKSAA